MKKILPLVLLSLFALSTTAKKKLPYQNAKLPVEQRVSDLLHRMSLEEKVGQLRCTLAWNYYKTLGRQVVVSESFRKDLAEGNIGMLWATFRADPWTQKSLSNGLTPEMAAKTANILQDYVMDHTRWGIPLFLAEEAPHGHMAIGTTVFPTGLGLAATFSPETAEAMGRVVSKEVRLQGAHISYGPVLDLSRDPRWSRVEESMGEDPVLTGTMGAALVRGLGGGDLSKPYSTLATLKHFIAYGTTEGGQNGNQSIIGQRDLLQNFLPPFKKAIDAGALSVMTSYNSLDGIPSTASRELYTDLLRRQWGFRGFVVSDLYSIDGIWETHHVAPTLQQAGVMSLTAGVDEDLGGRAYAELPDAVRKGLVSEALVDTACARVLRMKFEMGLFEHPYVDEKAARQVRCEEHKAVALDAARKLITLLKNENHTLPLNKTAKVAVVGPNADNIYNMLGDYTAPQEDGNVKTILMGIKAKLPQGNVEYVKGCAVRDTLSDNIEAAVQAARRADVVVVAVGGSSARDFKTSYKATGAAEADTRSLSDMDCGEGYDRATLSLLGHQQKLLEALRSTGKPLVVVYIEGRPLDKAWAAEHADALLTAYYPGQEGGTAIADVLFGDYNPAGRLPVSVSRTVGQLPVYYNKRAPKAHNYVEMTAQPLYSFGYGLSYTTFSYGNLQVRKQGEKDFCVSFDITNTGSRDGDEVAQLYLHDEVASVVQPMKQLKHFARVYIKKGETQHLEFDITPEDLEIIGKDYRPVVEPGDFEVLVGSSSDNILLHGKLSVE
ncbi:glycoside hydrolase family 3 N-terminal domain-containing protein [Prevotella sp. KH2C16]|uniref:glycoside hydrolase family 3 N-terminal domain-containing protein n=1 Tax=Prevotella sp. KH2C16 TaxID=1855325 RepID=UPI0008E67767|nr:glycoside hydrolase family 3 N-terminal domain-containing protein [Prevotella sp. KH2C16]SFG03710.1 beta-glucosidase [Prevotella sp. KH2C16]